MLYSGFLPDYDTMLKKNFWYGIQIISVKIYFAVLTRYEDYYILT